MELPKRKLYADAGDCPEIDTEERERERKDKQADHMLTVDNVKSFRDSRVILVIPSCERPVTTSSDPAFTLGV